MDRWICLALILAALPGTGAAQTVPSRDTVTVVPGPQYRAGGLHRLFFGTRYRALWTTPIRVPVLDLQRFAGGLTPLRRGGGMQTLSLRFKGADGKEYAFRSMDKDPTPLLPPELRETVAADIVRDQISAAHPAAPLVAAPLLEAAGVLHATPLLVKLPDDPALGEFRAAFGGLLGMIEERPRELDDEGMTFAGASEIIGTPELLKKLDDDPEVRVDAEAFLLARLTDVFLGDWDRHADQWRWARVARNGREAWLPIPRDRDQAFVRLDGFILSQARRASPQLLNFGPAYGAVSGATWNGRNLDRRFLTGLERPVWDSVSALLTARLTDQVIAAAVRRLPPEWYALDGARLESTLRARRDRLPRVADGYYRLLAGEVDIFASDKPDQATVTRREDGRTVVAISHKDTTYYQRTFSGKETREIRLYLQGGPDRLTVRGTGGGPAVRVIGGGGNDEFMVDRAGGIHLYDDRGENKSSGSGINQRAWTWKADSLDPRILPPRDWGRKTVLLATGSFGPDLGAVLGYRGHTDWYGFRGIPFAHRLDYGFELSSGKTSGRLKLGYTRQFENSRGFVELGGMASGIESLRWYGFGNTSEQSVGADDARFYRLSQNALTAGLRLGMRFGQRNRLAIGPVLRWSDTDLGDSDNADRFIAIDRPYGTGMFGLLGVAAELVLDGRDHPRFATRGVTLALAVAEYAGVWDADKALGRLDAEGSIALAPRGSWQPSLNLMAGGSLTWGKIPFFVAPTLGGTHTLRGYRPDRFAGENSLYGSAELRVPLTRIKFVVPGQQGFFAYGDAGRVTLAGQDAGEWHTTVGGGVWFSFLNRDSVLLIGAGKPTKGSEGARVIVGFGFPY